MVETLRAEFAEYNLTYSIGGQISFDVFPQVRARADMASCAACGTARHSCSHDTHTHTLLNAASQLTTLADDLMVHGWAPGPWL